MFINNCMNNGDTSLLTNVENVGINYFQQVMNTLFSLSDQAFKLDEYGSDRADKAWDKANDIMYLQVYLEIVSLSIRQDIANSSNPCGDPNITYKAYDQRFKLNCVKQYYRCLGIDPEPLFSIYGINQPLGGGIAFDAIEEGDCSILTIQ